jgi:hypothetical protein
MHNDDLETVYQSQRSPEPMQRIQILLRHQQNVQYDDQLLRDRDHRHLRQAQGH